MKTEIEQQIDRVASAASVQISEIGSNGNGRARIKLSTTHASYELPGNRLLLFLHTLPNNIGIEALRQTIEQKFPNARV